MAVIPGLGGTPDQPRGYIRPDLPGVSAGSNNVVVARRVIIIGSGGELLVYSPTAGAGNLVASVAGAAGTDQFGNHFLQNVATYSATAAAQMTQSDLDFYSGSQAAGWTLRSQIIADSVGNLSITSGAAMTLFANAGTIDVSASGGVTIGGSANTGNGSNGGVTSGPSGTVNSFPAAGPNHTHAEVHTHPL